MASHWEYGYYATASPKNKMCMTVCCLQANFLFYAGLPLFVGSPRTIPHTLGCTIYGTFTRNTVLKYKNTENLYNHIKNIR